MAPTRPLRVAIIGSGPSAIFAADHLLQSGRDVAVDVIERLPAPFGLVRYGVAPDHPRIKQVIASFSKVLGGGVRLLANVEVGTDVHLAELRESYDAIIVATGAMRDAPLPIPGIDLRGSHGAAELVSWYDGHPDAPREWPLGAREVAVIGVGNVALDIARILARRAEELASTDIPDSVLNALRGSAVTDVHVFGRRGPDHVKFTPLELREIGHLEGVDVVVHPEDFVGVADANAPERDRRAQQVAAVFADWVERVPTEAPRRVHLHLFHRPVEVVDDGTGAVGAMRFERMRQAADGSTEGTGEIREYPIQAVYRAVGYHGAPIVGLPFDQAAGVLPTAAGRVIEADGTPVPGVYATGWIKRGPSGLIGSSKSDAGETVESLLADADSLMASRGDGGDPDAVLTLAAARGTEVVTWAGWEAIDAHERALGVARGCDRVKVVSRDEAVSIALGRG